MRIIIFLKKQINMRKIEIINIIIKNMMNFQMKMKDILEEEKIEKEGKVEINIEGKEIAMIILIIKKILIIVYKGKLE